MPIIVIILFIILIHIRNVLRDLRLALQQEEHGVGPLAGGGYHRAPEAFLFAASMR